MSVYLLQVRVGIGGSNAEAPRERLQREAEHHEAQIRPRCTIKILWTSHESGRSHDPEGRPM